MEKGAHNLWYKDAVIYQIHVQAYFDSNSDGKGDFKGLIQKLDYVKSLGVTALWLLPFYPSPLRDGGYDIADFTGIHPSYGSLSDFKRFIREAHNRDLKVITELVLNHTSNQHAWFKRAQQAKPGSSYRDFYVWSDTPDKYQDARIIFQDFELSNWSWDPVAKAYYWHRFYSHQPDLNYDNTAVHKAVYKLLDFWFNIGVDGLRLDAVPYLYEREGTNCENLPETHNFLKKIRSYVDKNHENKMLLAEANQWPEDSCEYFGDDDECHMAFHFPLMPRLFMAMRMEDRFPIIDILEQTPDIPQNAQWAIFLRNHDELTLEMVSDEERDYMYKAYAQEPEQRINLGIRRRLAPLLGNDRRRIELMNTLLFSLPGTPIVYYGDEIGMGDNYYLGDRDGVRTPMQWTPDKNAGFSDTKPQKLYLPVIIDHDYHYEALNVESQERNPSSLLWWMRRMIATRKKYRALSQGTIRFVPCNNPKILAFLREYQDEHILVVVNLSRYAQVAEIEMEEFAGYYPIEVFSQNHFPEITDKETYTLTLQYKEAFWFELQKQEETDKDTESRYTISFTAQGWKNMDESIQNKLKEPVLNFVKNSRWFRGKTRKIKGMKFIDFLPVYENKDVYTTYLSLVEIDYLANENDYYVMPLSIAVKDELIDLRAAHPHAIIAQAHIHNEEGVIYDATFNKVFQDSIFNLIYSKGKSRGKHGELLGIPGKTLKSAVRKTDMPLPSKIISAEQSNSSILYDQHFFFKIYRAPEQGSNPEVDILQRLTNKTTFTNFPVYAGSLDYSKPNEGNLSLGLLTGFMPNEGNAWDFTHTFIDQYFEKLLSHKSELLEKPGQIPSFTEHDGHEQGKTTGEVGDLIGYFFLEMTEKMAQRTGEMHLAFASLKGENEFEPENFSLLYQKSMYQSFRTLIKKTSATIKQEIKNLDDETSELGKYYLDNESEMLQHIKKSLETGKIKSQKTRVHGDYHLGQVLFTGKDFIIIDFEGEPARTLSARKLKYCPLKDVAGMLRSFHYAIYMGYFKHTQQVGEDSELLEQWLEFWYDQVSKTFLDAYLKTVGDADFIPANAQQIEDLLRVYIIEKAVYEAGYELNNRPDWLTIPLNGLKKIMEQINKEDKSDK
ncbi:MAG: maltose alpha-D-glucosyltransferase [Bacteroidetes bacterium]|jgi:maltose alpha-D-glucosyltransferase/alpha-amylase|nr:maltose alpha-D-glucosyltransferase [Bacteroidota bacterium]